VPAALARIIAGPNAPAAARERAAEFAHDVVSPEQAALLRLLVSEAVTEAVERAYGRRLVLELRLERHAGSVRVDVSHAGSPADRLRVSILEQAEAWAADADGHLWFVLRVGPPHAVA
jgi:hypothetical protein